MLVLETILGSNTGTNDPVGVALNEAIADGACDGKKNPAKKMRKSAIVRCHRELDF